jgi:DNA-binding NarL/FixJ family response regulator
MEQIKIGLVDDNERWLKGCCSFLNSHEDLMVVWSATNRETALYYAENSMADIILMDVNLKDDDMLENYDGVFSTIEILESNLNAKIIVVSSTEDHEIILNALIAGAVNFINKKDFEKAPDMICSVFYNNHNPLAILSQDYSRLKRAEMLQVLSGAEKEVFELLEQGYSQSQIAEQLFKAKETVKKQVNMMLKKLAVSSTKEAIQKVKLKGLTDLISKRKETGVRS